MTTPATLERRVQTARPVDILHLAEEFEELRSSGHFPRMNALLCDIRSMRAYPHHDTRLQRLQKSAIEYIHRAEDAVNQRYPITRRLILYPALIPQ